MYPECAGCGKNLASTGGAMITIGSLKSHLRKRFPDGYVSVHACNSREVFVDPKCFAAAWRKYSTTEPPER